MTVSAAPPAGDIGSGLRLDRALLQAAQQILGLGERKADRVQPIAALFESEHFAVVDHLTILGGDLELDLHAHGPSRGWVFQNAERGKPDRAGYPSPPSIWPLSGLFCNQVCSSKDSRLIHARLHRAGRRRDRGPD